MRVTPDTRLSKTLAIIVACEQAGHPRHYARRRVAANGAMHIEIWCPTCHQNITRQMLSVAKVFLSAEDCGRLLGIEPDDLPLESVNGRLVALCQVCRTWGPIEMHHILPRAIFPPELAEAAGEIPLCQGCHAEVTEVWETWRLGRVA